ncbi:complement resistance protein TraT [Telmatospirillum sp.]|uniref:complement resistance protein TraT n=1 Tax=Telmatospirillum sp. TaxID=2079197 RepID=UPI00284768E1|nr:complement resistance protein TraT [Telmatospirillum sp.]MDR3439201.1 complement resistance protein TraT [Telmatospirillum sp.]
MQMNTFSRLMLSMATAGTLAACAAADSAINHGDITVQTHMSETVFLDPVPPDQKTIFVSARNTSDHPEIDLRSPLIQAVASRGYTVVQDPNQAHYMLRVNVLQAGKIETKDKESLLSAKYGEPLLAGLGAGALASMAGGDRTAATATGLGVAAGSFLLNQAFQTVTYSVVVDVQLSERPLKGAKVKQSTTTVAAQANGSSDHARTSQTPTGSGRSGTATLNANVKTQQVDEESDFKQYQLRDIAYADQMNLKFEEAAPQLVTKLAYSLSNLFE